MPVWCAYLVLYICVFMFGIVIGSFLNVCIYRYPKKESLLKGSHCIECGYHLRWYDLIPLFSFLILREVPCEVIASVSPRGRNEWSIICDRFLGKRFQRYERDILSPDIRPNSIKYH